MLRALDSEQMGNDRAVDIGGGLMLERAALEFFVGALNDEGEGPFLACDSPAGRYRAIFEDDGATGYFYALDIALGQEPIVDALQIYSVAQVTDRDKANRVNIAWSSDGAAASLLINGYAHADFDFNRQRGWCRSGFPPPSAQSPWDQQSHAWNSEADALLSRCRRARSAA